MKLLLVIDDYLPQSIKVGAKMMHELALELQKMGHEVTVLTPSAEIASKTMERFEGVNVWRFPSGKIKNVGKVRRAYNEMRLSDAAWKAFSNELKSTRHDIIVYYSPTICWGTLVNRLKRTWNVPAYLILRDIFPQWAVDRGLIRKGSLVERVFLHFEKINYEVADVIGLMSRRNLDWFRENKECGAILEILPNWASDTPVEPDGRRRKELGLDGKVIFFYGGNIGHAQDMMNVVRLAKRMRAHPEAHFLLVGAGDEFDLVKDAIEKETLTNMTLLPAVPQEEFKKLQAECDVGLFTLDKKHTTHNFPGKLLGYMVQRMPILGSVNPGNDLKEVVEGYGAGYVSVNGEDDLFYENATKLLDPTRRKEMGVNAKRLLTDRFSVHAAAEKILSSIRE